MAAADSRPVIARLDPAHGSAPLFIPMKKGKPRPPLHVRYKIGGCVLEWSAREALDIHDESVLLALIALAGVRGLFRDLPVELRQQMQINGDLDDGEPGMVFSSWYELARWAGIRNRSSKTKRQVRESVRRLSEVILWVRLPLGRVYRMQLVAHVEMDDEGLAIALNSRLVRALCPKAHYASVNLTDRNLLRSDTARALHTKLSSTIHVGNNFEYDLERLERLVYGENAARSVGSMRKKRLRQALPSLPGDSWGIAWDEQGRMVTVARKRR